MKRLLLLFFAACAFGQVYCPYGTVGTFLAGTPYLYNDLAVTCFPLAAFTQTRTYYPTCLSGGDVVNGNPNYLHPNPTAVGAAGSCGWDAIGIPTCGPFFFAGPTTTNPGPNQPGYQEVDYSSLNATFIGYCAGLTSGGVNSATCDIACNPLNPPNPNPPPPPSPGQCGAQPPWPCNCWICQPDYGWVCYDSCPGSVKTPFQVIERPTDGVLKLQLDRKE